MESTAQLLLTNVTSRPSELLIKADLLIPGRGDPQHDAALVCNAERILYVGPQLTIPEPYLSLDAIEVPILMPGLWDCHTHFLGTKEPASTIWKINPVVVGARGVRDAAELLNAGYTSVRECGGTGIFLDKVIEDGFCFGPKIYSCGAMLSCTGGHGDGHDIPLAAWLNACQK